MKLLSFNTRRRKEGEDFINIGRFFFREDNKNYGPLEIRLPTVFGSVPLSNDELPRIKEDLKERLDDSHIVEIKPYSSVKSIIHVTARQSPYSLEEVLHDRRFHKFFRNDKFSYSDWLRLKYDWTRDVELPQKVEEMLMAQKEAHKLLREINEDYYLDGELAIVRNQDQIREIAAGKARGDITNLVSETGQMKGDLTRVSNKMKEEMYGHTDPNIARLAEIISEYDFQIDFKQANCQLYSPDIEIFDFEFGDTNGNGFGNLAYDIETTKYRTSYRNPDGINSKVALTAICAEMEYEGYDHVVVGYLDIGKDEITSEKYGTKAKYIQVQDGHMVRRKSSDVIFVMDPHYAGGHNHDAFDLSRSINPNRDDAVIADLDIEKRYKKLFTEGDGMFRVNPDNSEPRYSGKSWLETFTYSSINVDTLNFGRNYLSSLVTDYKLETIGKALDFYLDFGLGFEKSVHGYNDLENLIERAEQGDTEAGYEAAVYAYEDNIAQLEILKFFSSIFSGVSQKLHIDENYVMKSSKSNLAGLYFDRKFFDERGIERGVFEKDYYSKFDVEASKDSAFEKAFKRVYGIEPETDKGCFNNVAVFFTPYFTEGAEALVRQDENMFQLYDQLLNSDNVVEKVILQQVMDSLVAQYTVDAKMVLDKKIYGSEFYIRHKMDYRNFISDYRERMDEVAELFNHNSPINYSGNLVFVDASDEDLVSRLKENNFTHIGTGDIISVGKGRVIYGFKKNNDVHVASSKFQIMSPKKRFTSDNTFQGYNPNFYDNLMYDLVEAYFKGGRFEAQSAFLDFINNFDSLPIEDYFITMKAGKDREDYSSWYRNFRRFKEQDYFDMEAGQKEIIVVEGEEDVLELTRVDTSNPDSWSSLEPYMPYYEKAAFQKTRNLYKLLNSMNLSYLLQEDPVQILFE